MFRVGSILSFVLAFATVACDPGALIEADLEPSFAKGANAAVHQVSGGGTVDVPDGRSTYAFHASVDGGGAVKGQVELHFSSSPIEVHGTVTCLVVDGSQAWLGAVITRSDAETGAFVVGGDFVWTAQDNGEGAGAAPDLVSSFFGGPTADFCATKFSVFQRDWTNGNVRIR